MDNPIIKIDADLSKPANTLVEKIADAFGGYFKPWQMKRVAKAGAEVARIEAESRIQVTDIQRRAMGRWVTEEGARQANIESITQQALPLLGQDAAPQDIGNDWITNFFDKARIVSDSDMQKLWSRVLAGEATAPGAFSKRTVNILGDLDKSDAQLFTSLCGFAWTFSNPAPIIIDLSYEAFVKRNLTFGSLTNLEALGLLRFNASPTFALKTPPNQIIITSYFGRMVFLNPHTLNLGVVILTQPGEQLARVCGATPVDGYFEYMLRRWGGLVNGPDEAKRLASNANPQA